MRDGRAFSYDPHNLIAAFEANKGPLPIDYEHAQDSKAPKGELAPAAGWITGLEIRENALWANVEWTDCAAEMIAAKEYRFISPSMRLDGATLVCLAGAALVNRPALKLPALDETGAAETPNVHQKARQLASDARNYQENQRLLGKEITISEAVFAISGGIETALKHV